MRCHVCNAEVGDNQRFCHECGESLAGVTDPTAAVDMNEVLTAPDEQLPTQAVELGTDDGIPDPWATPTGDQPVTAPDDDATIVGAVPVESIADAPVLGEPAAGEVPADEPLPGAPAIAGVAPGAALTAPTEPPVDDATVVGAVSAAAVATGGGDPNATTTLDALVSPAGTSTDPYGADQYGVAATTVTDAVTGEYPNIYDGAPELAAYPPEREPVRFRLTLVLGVLAVLTAALASIADITDVRTDRVVPGIENRLRGLDDIGSNLAIAVFIGAGLMLVGGVLHCFNHRWGAGLAGGAGLAVGGWASVTIGLAEVPISVAERITRDPATPGPFILTVTRDLGYWLIIALGVLGGLAFLLSLVSAGTGGRRGLDPWTAAVGALGGVVAAAGPLIPVGNATFSSNFGVNELPMAFFAGRLVQVAVLGLTAMIGFLLVRRWGLGLVAGGLSVPTFMWLTTLLEVGDAPIGIGVGNLGTADITPHAVTTAGMAVALVMLVAAAVVAVAQRDR